MTKQLRKVQPKKMLRKATPTKTMRRRSTARVTPKLGHYSVTPTGYDADHPHGKWRPGLRHWRVKGKPACRIVGILSRRDAPNDVTCLACIKKFRD